MAVILFLCFFVVCIQVTTVHFFAILNAKPDLLVILTIYLALYPVNKDSSFGYGFFLGFLEDIFSTATPLGTNALLKGVISYFVNIIKINIYQENKFIQMILAGCAGILNFLFFAIFGTNMQLNSDMLLTVFLSLYQ